MDEPDHAVVLLEFDQRINAVRATDRPDAQQLDDSKKPHALAFRESP
jgi:hypothetical protein